MLKVFLEQIKGPQKNLKIEIKKGTTSVGRNETDIIIPNSKVSNKQCEIHYNGTRVYVYDNKSTNGTYVNKKRIKKTALKDGDLIYIAGDEKNAVALFRINIIREVKTNNFIYLENQPKKLKFYLLITLGIFLILFLIWIITPTSKEIAIEKIKIEKPWQKLENVPSVPYSLGVKRVLAFNDEVYFPPNYTWKVDVRYENTKKDQIFEPRLYIIDINSINENNKMGEELSLNSIVTIQRFLENYNPDLEKVTVSTFVWNEVNLNKKNNINFKYYKTPKCLWQWGVWENNKVFNLYATCVSLRGRMIVQASSYNKFLINRFFNFFSQSYKEGSMDY